MRQGNGGVLHNSVKKKHSISTYDTNRQTRLMRRFFCKVSTIRRYERNTFSNPKWLLFGTKSGPYLQLFVSIRLQSFSDRASSAKKCLDPMRTTHTNATLQTTTTRTSRRAAVRRRGYQAHITGLSRRFASSCSCSCYLVVEN